MKAMIGLTALLWLLLLVTGFVATRAEAHDVATRCGRYSCSTIVCNRTGDRCRRYDEDGRDWRSDRDRYQDSEYWRYRDGRWRSNCDSENPTCVVRANRFDDHYEE